MSDFNSSLPVRTENNGDVRVFIADSTTPSQLNSVDTFGSLSSIIKDASGNAVTTQANGTQRALDVGINIAGIQIDPRQIRALTAADVVTAAQGTTPWITKDQSDGPVTPGTVASFSSLAGGQYNLTPPTLTTGQQSALQLDANGRLLVDAAITSTDDHNYGTVGANTLRTAAQIGNATGAADFNAGATGAQTLRVQANQGAPGLAANGWFVRPTDGTNSQSYTAAGEAKVSVTQPLPAGTNAIGTVNASNFPTTVDTNYGTVGANTLRSAAQIGNATGAADFNAGATGAQTLRTTANQGAPNTAANAWPISITSGGAVNSATNPVFVTTDTIPGTSVNDYKRAIAIAAGASDTHDYTVTAAKTLYLNQIEATGSGKAKVEVEIETGVGTGIFTTRWVMFNSTADPNMTLHIDNAIAVAAGVRVRVIITNKDVAAADLYTTISGYELP